MRPIPAKLRKELGEDWFMKRCIYERPDAPNRKCRGRITFEHAFLYAGRQINEKWAILPCCEAHNSGEAMVKDFNRYVALERANLEDLARRMPKRDWGQLWKFLSQKYGNYKNSPRR